MTDIHLIWSRVHLRKPVSKLKQICHSVKLALLLPPFELHDPLDSCSKNRTAGSSTIAPPQSHLFHCNNVHVMSTPSPPFSSTHRMCMCHTFSVLYYWLLTWYPNDPCWIVSKMHITILTRQAFTRQIEEALRLICELALSHVTFRDQ